MASLHLLDLLPGQTFETAPETMLIGKPFMIMDRSYTVTNGVQGYRTGREIWVMLVKNNSGATLGRKLCVKWGVTAGDVNKNIAALTSAGDVPAGVVDPYAAATGVPIGHYFLLWLLNRDNPLIVTSDGSGALAPMDVIVTAGSATGKIKKQVAAPADTTAAMVQVNSRVGLMNATLAATDGLTGDAIGW